MNVKEAREYYYALSASASASARQLSFAGIAVVWLMATKPELVQQPLLRAPLLTFVLALGLDLLQYYVGSVAWSLFAHIKERAGVNEFGEAPDAINWPALACFWLKGVLVVIGYAMLVFMLWPVLFAQAGR